MLLDVELHVDLPDQIVLDLEEIDVMLLIYKQAVVQFLRHAVMRADRIFRRLDIEGAGGQLGARCAAGSSTCAGCDLDS